MSSARCSVTGEAHRWRKVGEGEIASGQLGIKPERVILYECDDCDESTMINLRGEHRS